MKINGKEYAMWGALVENKADWIGGVMTEHDSDCGESVTTIKDITLEPYGEDGALFSVEGDGWGCCVNVAYGGVSSENGNLCIHGYSQSWTLQKPT